jgi:hypothetical protein
MFAKLRSRFSKKPKQGTTFCPVCHGENIELTNQVYGREDNWKKEIYFCRDCESHWDWTFEQPCFHFPKRSRPPRWVKID